MYLIITVDLETSYSTEIKTGRSGSRSNHAKPDLVDVMIFGLCDGERYGFQKIIEICKKQRRDCSADSQPSASSYRNKNGGSRSNRAKPVKATFFVSSLDSCKFGEDVFQSICNEIVAEGHDAQVHTHPVRLFNDGREHLWQYPLDEQRMILKTASEQIKKWTGENPVAHRAGAYGINEETFVALKENGVPIDSSSFYGHPNCKAVVTKNKIVEHNGIIEIPVTVFRRVRRVKLGNWVLKRQSSFVKTDIDWASLDELKSYVQQAKENDIKAMTLFMHSYSLLKFDQDFTLFEPDWNDIEKLDRFLNVVANDPEIKVITMKEFYEMYQQDPEQFIGSDYVPVVEYKEQFNPIKYGARRVKSIIWRLIRRL